MNSRKFPKKLSSPTHKGLRRPIRTSVRSITEPWCLLVSPFEKRRMAPPANEYARQTDLCRRLAGEYTLGDQQPPTSADASKPNET